MSEKIVLGIDLGTSAVKILAIDSSGTIVSSGEENYSLNRSNNQVEQNPEDWWQAVKTSLKKMNFPRKNLEAIGLSGQLNSLVLVGDNGCPLRDAIIWLDRRAVSQAEYLNQKWGKLLEKYTLSRAEPLYNLSKLQWVKEKEPENLDNCYKILGAKDYLNYKLTENFVTDVSEAGAALMLNLRERKWAEEMLEKIIPLEKLPQLHESVDIAGQVTARAARELNIPENIPVTAGAGDMAALTLGTGVIEENTACATIGTAGHIAAYLSEFPQEADPRIWVMAHAIPGEYFWHGLVMTGGYCLQWFLENFAPGKIELAAEKDKNEFDLLLHNISEVPPGSRGLLFLPFLNGAATPHQNSEARSSFVGLTSNHSQKEMVRAILEGVAYNIRDSFEIIDPKNNIDQVMMGEGGSKNIIWPRIVADVLGKDAIILSELNASALGAAMLAGVGGEIWQNFHLAKNNLIQHQEILTYNQKYHSLYNKCYQTYSEIYQKLEDSFSKLSSIEQKGENLNG